MSCGAASGPRRSREPVPIIFQVGPKGQPKALAGPPWSRLTHGTFVPQSINVPGAQTPPAQRFRFLNRNDWHSRTCTRLIAGLVGCSCSLSHHPPAPGLFRLLGDRSLTRLNKRQRDQSDLMLKTQATERRSSLTFLEKGALIEIPAGLHRSV